MAARPTQSKRPSEEEPMPMAYFDPQPVKSDPAQLGSGRRPGASVAFSPAIRLASPKTLREQSLTAADYGGRNRETQLGGDSGVVDCSESKDNEKPGSWLHGRTSYSTSSSVKERPRW